jgi:Ca-activated chloride channel family protein
MSPRSHPDVPARAVTVQVSLTPLKPALIGGQAHTLAVLVRVQAPDADPARAQERRPFHLSLVIDRSGAMSGQSLSEAVRCTHDLFRRLQPTDVVSLVTFDHRASLLAPARRVGDRSAQRNVMAFAQGGGNTSLHGGWATGADSLLPDAASASIARIILLTDGSASAGARGHTQAITAQCTAASARGVTTSTCGLGREFDESLMTTMARAGGGNPYYGETTADLFEPFAEEFDLISSLYARQVRLSIATCPGVGMKVLNGYPMEPCLGAPAIQLPDIAWGAEAWALVELSIPAGFVLRAGAPLMQAGVTASGLDNAPIPFREAALSVDTVSQQGWDALTADPLVQTRLAEVEASRLLEQAHDATHAGDWDRAQGLIDAAHQRFTDQPWPQVVVASLRRIARRQDKARFGKESLYMATRMRSRLASKHEARYDALHEAAMPRFLRRNAVLGHSGCKGGGSRRDPAASNCGECCSL